MHGSNELTAKPPWKYRGRTEGLRRGEGKEGARKRMLYETGLRRYYCRLYISYMGDDHAVYFRLVN